MEILGLIGILVSLVLFILLVYKGWSVLWVAPICAVLVAVTNSMDPVTAITEDFIGGLLGMAGSIFVPLFLGVILGRLYNASGAADSVATGLMNVIVDKWKGKNKVYPAVLCLLILGAILSVGGIDPYVCFFIVFPVSLMMAKKLDMPRRFIPGMLVLNTPFMAAPGAPTLYNILAKGVMASMGIELPNVFGLTGYVAVAIMAIGSFFILSRMITNAMNKGEVFDLGGIDPKLVREDTEKKRPNFWLSLIPLVAVFVCYAIFNLPALIALTIGIVLNLVLLQHYIPSDGRCLQLGGIKQFFGPNRIINTINDGAEQYPNALMMLCSPAGFAAVITGTATFGLVIQWLTGIEIHPYLLVIPVAIVTTGLTSSPIVGISVTIPLIMGVAAASGIDIDPAHAARLTTYGAQTFETLPTNGAILLSMLLAKTTHKEAYKPQLYMTVGLTTLSLCVLAVLYVAFPMLP